MDENPLETAIREIAESINEQSTIEECAGAMFRQAMLAAVGALELSPKAENYIAGAVVWGDRKATVWVGWDDGVSPLRRLHIFERALALIAVGGVETDAERTELPDVDRLRAVSKFALQALKQAAVIDPTPAEPHVLVQAIVQAASAWGRTAPQERDAFAERVREASQKIEPADSAAVAALTAEVVRLAQALSMIRDGWISPSIGFAERVLDGAAPLDAHAAECEARRERDDR